MDPALTSLRAAALPALVVAMVLVLAKAHGAYFPGATGAAAALALTCLAGLAFAGTVPTVLPTSRSRIALALLAGLVTWTAIGARWAGDVDVVLQEVVRSALYATIVLLATFAATSASASRRLLLALVAAPCACAVIVVARTPASFAHEFVEGRLVASIGYQNAVAALVASVVWPAIVLAGPASGRRPWMPPVLVGGASLAVQVAVLTQSRASLVTLAVTALFTVVLARHRVLLVALASVVLAPAALNWRSLNAPFVEAAGGRVPPHAVELLGPRIVVAAVMAALVVALVQWTAARIEHREVVARSLRVVVASVGCALVLAASAVLVHERGTVRTSVTSTWSAFQREPTGDHPHATRFLSASNDGRLVMWRTAVRAFRSEPVHGVGAGNWSSWYYRYRSRDVGFARQPHGLVLELLAERGLIGAGLLLAALGCALSPTVRRRRDRSDDELATIVAAAALVVGWFVHAQLDWTWQVPAVTVGPMVAVGVLLVAPWRSPAPETRTSALRRTTLGSTALALALLATIPGLATRMLHQAEQASDPQDAAIRLAWIDDHYPFAADVAHARARTALRLGDPAAAARFERVAITRDPRSYARWELGAVLCDDLGDEPCAAARRAQARALDPHGDDPDVVGSDRHELEA